MRLFARKNVFLKTQGKEKFSKSVGHALDGIEYAINNERNIKIQIILGVIASVMGFLLEISVIEWVVVILLMATILALELINTAIERTVDLITKDYEELAKVSKDMAAGAVLVVSMFSVVIGILIYLPKIIDVLKGVK